VPGVGDFALAGTGDVVNSFDEHGLMLERGLEGDGDGDGDSGKGTYSRFEGLVGENESKVGWKRLVVSLRSSGGGMEEVGWKLCCGAVEVD
jgi:hypothetical protein